MKLSDHYSSQEVLHNLVYILSHKIYTVQVRMKLSDHYSSQEVLHNLVYILSHKIYTVQV